MGFNPQEGTEGPHGPSGESVTTDNGYERLLAAATIELMLRRGAAEAGEEGLDLGEVAGAGEFEEDGLVGLGVVGEVWAVVVLGVEEDLEGEVGVVLAGNEGC